MFDQNLLDQIKALIIIPKEIIVDETLETEIEKLKIRQSKHAKAGFRAVSNKFNEKALILEQNFNEKIRQKQFQDSISKLRDEGYLVIQYPKWTDCQDVGGLTLWYKVISKPRFWSSSAQKRLYKLPIANYNGMYQSLF